MNYFFMYTIIIDYDIILDYIECVTRRLNYSKMHKRVGYLGIENQQDSVHEDRWDLWI